MFIDKTSSGKGSGVGIGVQIEQSLCFDF